MKRSTRLYILSVAHGKAEGINRAARRSNAAKTARVLRQIVKRGKIDTYGGESLKVKRV